MRLLIMSFAICLTGCGKEALRPVPDDGPAQGSQPVKSVDIQTLSDVLPNETAGAPTGTGLHRPAQTMAVLGNSERPGLWLETPLVHLQGKGRVRLGTGGSWVDVTLIPAGGPVTDQSRLSRAALGQLGVQGDGPVRLIVASVR